MAKAHQNSSHYEVRIPEIRIRIPEILIRVPKQLVYESVRILVHVAVSAIVYGLFRLA